MQPALLPRISLWIIISGPIGKERFFHNCVYLALLEYQKMKKPLERKDVINFLIPMLLFSCVREKEFSIDYLGQRPPGKVAALFAPDLISTNSYEHSAPAFSPDGGLVLWTVLDGNYKASLFEMVFQNGKWSAAYRPAFADTTADDYYPSFSPDGKKLYFSSRRNAPAGYPDGSDIRIWEVTRNAGGWEKPVPFDTTVSRGMEYAHSVAGNGSIYFSTRYSTRTNFNIWKAAKDSDGSMPPAVLPFGLNSVGYEDGPFIAPDESFLIFESDRPEGIEGSLDLYISFKNGADKWGLPVNMGPSINSEFGERFARLSPDGKYLFFGSTRRGNFDIYWVDAQIIDDLKASSPPQGEIRYPMGNALLNALDLGNSALASDLLEEWLVLHPDHLDAIITNSATLRRLKRFQEAEALLEGPSIAANGWGNKAGVVMEHALAKLGLGKDEEANILLRPLLTVGDQQFNRYKYLAGALLEMGKFEMSDDFFEKAMAIRSNYFEYYRRACAYALAGAKDRAFDNLNKAVELGYTSRQEFEQDEELEPLRPDARWQQLIANLK